MRVGGEPKNIGRELAVEALIDMHDRGPAYRANKIMDEAPAAALAARPIQVTRQMLVEQANSLSKYENKGEYLDLPLSKTAKEDEDGYSTPESKRTREHAEASKSRRELVMRHHKKIIKAKNMAFRAQLLKGATASASNSSHSHPPPQLVSSLRKIYSVESHDWKESSGTTNILPGLLQSIFEHEVVTNVDEPGSMAVGAKEEITPQNISPVANIETIIGNACVLDEDSDNYLQGLIIAAMSVLSACLLNTPIHEESIHGADESSDFKIRTDSLHNGLQVSGPLSLIVDSLRNCPVSDDLEGEVFKLHSNLMQYFMDASATYEERIDIQKAAIVSSRERLIAEKEKDTTMDIRSNDGGNDDDMPGLMQRRFGDDISSSDESAPFSDESSDSEQDIEEADGNEGGDADNNDDGGNTGDRDMERPLLQEDHNSSSDSDDDNEAEAMEEDDERDNEAYLLEEALAMSLAELNSATSTADNGVENDGEATGNEPLSSNLQIDSQEQIEGDVNTSFEMKSPSSSESKDDLPTLPTQPSLEIYKSLWDSVGMNICSDIDSKISQCMDPSSLVDYGKLPPSHIFVMLLRMIVSKVEKSHNSKDDKTTNVRVGKKYDPRRLELETMLRELSFGEETKKDDITCRDGHPFPDDNLHLIIASVHMLSHSRLEIFDQLCDEFEVSDSNSHHIPESQVCSESGYNTDDPAFALDNEIANKNEVFESLEEKGMVRKAAAAAHTAAVRREINQQKIETLRQLLRLLSISSCLLLRCLRLMFQDMPLKQDDSDLSPISCSARLRLSASITKFTSSSIAATCYTRLSELSISLDDRQKVDHALSPDLLMTEASALWGECAPNLMTSPTALDQQFRHTIESAFCKDARGSLVSCKGLNDPSGAAGNLKFPWCDADENLLKLGALCKRIRTADVLNLFIPGPVSSAPSSIVDFSHKVSATIANLGRELSKDLDYNNPIIKEIQHCYYALCHRFNKQILSWNGVLSSSNDYFDEKSEVSQNNNDIGSKLRIVEDSDLAFDASKCADSIAIIPSSDTGFSVNQRANKVWGTVLSTKYFEPKSGVHRWAVRLDRCERGHIFVGVGTARTSTKTYVGGDKNGWGVIGTQALWHDRKKIRSDYGRTFRTGALIVVTLDTDVGTLGFSVWKENAGSNLTPQNIRNQEEHDECKESGELDDWGVAFEGLPLDTRLFPAVGMYQRDDKATLVALERNDKNAENDTNFQSGTCFFPQKDEYLPVRQWNSYVCNEGIYHVKNVLNEAIGILGNKTIGSNDKSRMFERILPSIASSISSFPSTVPILSGRTAFSLLPLLLNCTKIIEERIEEQATPLNPTFPMSGGQWTIRATTTSNTSANSLKRFEEEYIVNLKVLTDNQIGKEFVGNGKGTSGASEGKMVSMHGSCRGNKLHFVEKWQDSPSSNETPSLCTVEARLNLDGTRFEGRYHNGNHDTSGMIVGVHESKSMNKSASSHAFQPNLSCDMPLQDHLVQCSYLLGLAVSHLTLILARGAPTRDVCEDIHTSCQLETKTRSRLSHLLVSSSILTKGLSCGIENSCSRLNNICELYKMEEDSLDESTCQISSSWCDEVTKSFSDTVFLKKQEVDESDYVNFDRIDALVAPQAGGYGSLSSLHSSYHDARKGIVKVILLHTGKDSDTFDKVKDKPDEYLKIWSLALQIIEARVRHSIMIPGEGKNRADACESCCNSIQMISSFLFEISHRNALIDFSLDEFKKLYEEMTTEEDISYLKQTMEEKSRISVLKFMSLKTCHNILTLKDCSMSTREAMLIGFYRLMNNKKSAKDSNFILAGSCGILQESLSRLVKETFFATNSLADDVLEMSKTSPNFALSQPGIQSLLLAIFTSFFLPNPSYLEILNGDRLWKLMKQVFSTSLLNLEDKDLNNKEFSQPTMANLSKWILSTSCAHTTLDLSRAAISLLHVTLFHIYRACDNTESEEISLMLTKPISLLRREILNAVRCLQEKEKEVVGDFNYEIASLECDRWNNTVEGSPLCDERKSIVQATEIFSINFPGGQDSRITSLSGYLTHFLDVFNILTKLEDKHLGVQGDIQFLKHLVHFAAPPGSPATSRRLRIRVMRLLRKPFSHCAPDEDIVSLLVDHLRNSLENVSQGNEFSIVDAQHSCLEAREVISLIRHLCSASRDIHGEHASWRDMVLNAYLNSNEDGKVSLCTIFGGIPGMITPGIFVLLKPPAAKNLQTMAQLKSNSDTRSVGGSLSPVAGAGIEGIVSGLCRKQAKGGIICKIDETTSTCEVLLLDRTDECVNSHNESISVRAIRVPFSDMTPADENGFLFDNKIPISDVGTEPLQSHLQNVLSDLHNLADNTDKQLSNGHPVINSYSALAILLRSNIPMLSDPDLFLEFTKNEESRICLSKILEIAALTSIRNRYPVAQSICGQSLKALPEFEARYWHLRSLEAAIRQRRQALFFSKEKLCHFYLGSNNCDEAGIKPVESKSKDDDGTTQNVSNFDINIDSNTERQGHIGESTENESASGSNNGASDDEDHDEENEEEEHNDDSDDEGRNRSEENEEMDHLREAAVVQMLELGLPRSWSEYALSRVGGTNIEAAVHFCLERSGDMERLLAEDRERSRGSTSGNSRRRNAPGASQLLEQLIEMGFPSHWCTEALAATGQNVDEALTWILTNGARLSALDEGDDNDADDDSNSEGGDDNDSTDDEARDGLADTSTNSSSEPLVPKADEKGLHSWPDNYLCPVRSISGRANIDAKTLEVSGHSSGGFSSVGTKGVLLTEGKWYYECVLVTSGCIQIGWADSSFSGHCQADRGDGCGDGPSSWAYDGWRRYRWHNNATEWGCRWQKGDVVGCLVDMDRKEMSFTLNGRGEEIGMGLAFSRNGFKPCGGVYACVSFNMREKVRLVIGGGNTNAFQFGPPHGYKAVGEAVLTAAADLENLMSKETAIGHEFIPPTRKPYLCDFSDTEHGHEIFAWQHRYYGADASVHLGVGRQRQSLGTTQVQKSLKSLLYKTEPQSEGKDTCTSTLDLLLTEVWKASAVQIPSSQTFEEKFETILTNIDKSFDTVLHDVTEEFRDVSLALSMLYARKLIMHIAISMSSSFQLSWFSRGVDSETARQFTTVLELCCSLSSEGWVGEAGTMSMASEALGLAISSNDRISQQRNAFSSLFEGRKRAENDTKKSKVFVTGATTQVLNVVKLRGSGDSTLIDPSNNLAACAEGVLGGEGVGAIIFVKDALQTAMLSSNSVVDVFLAYISRAVRILSNVEFQDEESGNEMKTATNITTDETDFSRTFEEREPDARLISFLTGLIMSGLISDAKYDVETKVIANSLFEAWTTGLMSQSVPWRMISAMTISALLNICPTHWEIHPSKLSPLRRCFQRLNSITCRRIWAERAALPVCSRYLQSLIDLQSSVNRFPALCSMSQDQIPVDAATPSSLKPHPPCDHESLQFRKSWEADEGWICSDKSWEVWTGTIEYFAVDWSPPPRSAVRSLMDSGDGPPLLREGCTVLRGLDWDDEGSGTLTGSEDGKNAYDLEKIERKKIKKERQKKSIDLSSVPEGQDSDDCDPQDEEKEIEHDPDSSPADESSKKKKKLPLPKLPVGRVISIEPWKGVPGVARRVRWDLTGEESIYRFGGDGGKFDIVHVEVNEKATRVVKRHPHSETAEQCAVRHGFGVPKTYNIILRIRKSGFEREEFDSEVEFIYDGVLELPDFGAGIEVSCRFHEDGAVTITEGDLIFGSRDSGWEARFGQPAFVPGSRTVLSTTAMPSNPFLKEDGIPEDAAGNFAIYEELLGSSSFSVKSLRNREDGGKVRVASEMRLVRGKKASKVNCDRSNILPPLLFDSNLHAPSLSISRDQRTVSCLSAEGRCTAFLSAGFSKGIHYWEVKIEQADVGSIYIGVAEKPKSSAPVASSFESPPRLNRWLGWGFVNFRATYNEGSERVYGSHCHAGDTVGVLLDCDAGRLSFFFDGVKYGEHILNDLGCAFENISPFGFNADGCGGGGAGQGAPSGEGGRGGRYPANGSARPKALWPVIGLRHPGDRVTISQKWMTNYGVDGSVMLRNSLLVDEVLQRYDPAAQANKITDTQELPDWLVEESFLELKRWEEGKWNRTETRANGPINLCSFGLNIDIDVSAIACAAACASLGMNFVLLPNNRVSIKRSAGRILELSEEAVILGCFMGKLWYRIVSQKSEGGSLKEGGGRAWFWDESEVVNGGLQLLNPSPANEIAIPLLDRFKCTGTLRVAYSSGAIMRSDIEILENVSQNIGVIPYGTVIPPEDIIERRMNSNGVVRFLVEYEPIGRGWISYRIRGGSEESVLELVQEEVSDVFSYSDPHDCANVWFEKYTKLGVTKISCEIDNKERWKVKSLAEFQSLLNDGIITGLTPHESDSLLSKLVTSIADQTDTGSALNCTYEFFCLSLFHALKAHKSLHQSDTLVDCDPPNSASHQAAALKIGALSREFPQMKALISRVALLRALNRRAQYALPLYSIRPAQEDSGIIGGLFGFGASVERLGKSRQAAHSLALKWVQAPSIGKRVRNCRELIFTSLKRDVMNSIVDVTTTPTSLSHDEYELPREIRTVRVNRLKARKAIEADINDIKKENTVFGQLQTELRGWSGSALRRGYVAKGHGGQKRAFKVKLIGEGVNDYSGPYREVFTDAMREVKMTAEESSHNILGILKPSPNNDIGVGENRDLSLFACVVKYDEVKEHTHACISDGEKMIKSHYSSHVIAKSEELRNQEESLAFLGKLVGTAVRHGIPCDLDLPLGTVWQRLCEEDANSLDILKEIDLIEYRRLKENSNTDPDIPESPLLVEQQRMFNAFAEGLSSILPVEMFSLFTGTELRDYFCGNKDIDVELLRKVVEYEGYQEDDPVIGYFWETLREMTTEERKLFLQFVWARSRMPLKESDFDAPFKIQKCSQNSGSDLLPSASTCFFSLSLPEYESKEVLREKLLFAINNVTTMESDYVTNDVEIGEGWRGL